MPAPPRLPSVGRALAALVALACLGAPAAAGGDPPLGFAALTDAPAGWAVFEPSLDAAAGRAAFSAAFDFAGRNADGNFEVFVLEPADGSLVQLTESPFGVGNFLPRLVPDGSAVVFRSAWDYVGENPAKKFQLFEVDVATGAIDQLTTNAEAQNVDDPALSGDGRYVVFVSNSNPTGQNADLSYELFRLLRATESLQQLTVTAGTANDQPSADLDGDRAAFRSSQDFDGSNPEKNPEIWLWRQGLGVVAVTETPAGALSENPALDAAGQRVAFLSRHDFTGAGTGTTENVWVADLGGPRPLFRLASVPGPLAVLPPAITPDGRYVYYETQRDQVGQNGDGNRELFRYDTLANVLEQVTDTLGGVATSQLSARATDNYLCFPLGLPEVLGLRSEHALDGANPGGNLDLVLAGPAASAPQGYGEGIAGQAGVPFLNAEKVVLGELFELGVENASGFPTLGALFLGHAPDAQPTGLGGDLLVAPDLTLLLSVVGGRSGVAFSVPLDATLLGGTLFAQAFVIDPFAPEGISATPGIELRAGF